MKRLTLILLSFLLTASVLSPLLLGNVHASEADRFGLQVNGDGQAVVDASDFQITWLNWAEFELVINGKTDDPLLGVAQDIDFGGEELDATVYAIEGWECVGNNDSFVYRLSKTNASQVNVDLNFRPNDVSDCKNTAPNNVITVDTRRPENANAYYAWVDEATIETIGPQGSRLYTQSTSFPNIFLRNSEAGDQSCQDRVVVDRNNDTLKFYELDADPGKYNGTPPQSAETRCPYNTSSFPPGNTDLKIINANDAKDLPPGTGAAQGGEAEAALQTCESEAGAFGFILCPILDWSTRALLAIEGWVTNRLELPDDFYGNESVETAWARIRNVAYIILIPILLLMVIATALGLNFVDAYTARRALPRLFIAVIFMALSYDLVVLMIEVVNGIGRGIGGLIAQPFGGTSALTLQGIFSPDGSDALLLTGLGGLSIVGIGAFALAGAITIPILASSFFVAALALLTIFFVLIFRQVILVALIIVAPFAILSWIFPGNDKLWKIWWNTFSKLLLLYPIVIAALVAGRAFASIVPASANSGIDSLLTILIKLAAYIGPFFLIPAVFRYAGGAFANLAGIVNQRSKGLFDRQRKFRADSRGRATEKAKRSSRYSDNNRVGKSLNTFTGAFRNPRRVGRSIARGNMEAIRAGRQSDRMVMGNENLKNDEIFQANQGDDNFLIALADMDMAKKFLEKEKGELKEMAYGTEDYAKKEASITARQRGIDNALGVKTRKTAATRTAAFQALNKTGYQYDAGEEGYEQMATIAASIAGDDKGAMSSLMSEGQYHAKNAQRFDLAGINFAAGYSLKSGIDKASLYEISNAKKQTIDGWTEDLMKPTTSPDDRIVAYMEYQAMLPNSKGGNRKAILEGMEALRSTGIETRMADVSGNIDPATGVQREISVRANYDRERATTDAAYAATWKAEEVERGWKMVNRVETMADVLRTQARTYERPDPNNIET